jgi:OmpA-OmpF porin, OOP family
MKRDQFNKLSLTLAMGCALAVPGLAQEASKDVAAQPAAAKSQVVTGQKQKIKGVILKREGDKLTMSDLTGAQFNVLVSSSTKIEEKKGNPFRGAKTYSPEQLYRGLNLEVEGHGDGSGTLVADKLRFTEQNLVVAQTVESRVTPVEGRVGSTEERMTQAEQNSQRLSGQIEELSAVANAAGGGAKAAQETADRAVAGVNTTNERISTLVVNLDEYEPTKAVTVNFKVNSAVLSPEAMASLDELATQAKSEKGYIIEVQGFASADGDENKNRVLSQRRSDAVMRYLAENHMIPMRRIIIPFGYGESNPVADNATREGREQNRRVEVKILTNKGLTSPTQSTQAHPTSAPSEPVRASETIPNN